MWSIATKIRSWLVGVFPWDSPVLNRVGHALAAYVIAAVVTATLTLPWRILGAAGDPVLMPAFIGSCCGTTTYGFKEVAIDDHPDLWDFLAAAIGAAAWILTMLLGLMVFT